MNIGKHIISILVLLLASWNIALASEPWTGERWKTLPHPPAMPKAIETGYASVNGIKMYYAIYGNPSGKPVLFIHGGLSNADVWAYQVNGLSPDYKIIVADSRGHGRSTRTEAPFGYDLMTSDYVALLDHLHIKKVDLVGWSDGGIIGIDMAMSHPERLKHVFAQSANVTTDGVNGDVANGKQFTDYVNWMESEYKRLSPTPNEYKSFVDQIAKMWETQPNWTKAQLSKIKTPILIVAADHDVIWLAHQEYMAKAIPSAKLLVLEDTSHFAMLQDPKGYNQDIIKFFGK